MRALLVRCSALALVVASLGSAARAQVTAPAASGSAQDSTGAATTGAKIEVRNADADQPLPTTADFLNAIAHGQEEHRKATIAAITTRQAAEARQQFARKTLLAMMGGLPAEHGSLNARVYGTFNGNGYRVERITYDPLPNFHVTADLYLPTAGNGPYPAIISSPGHGSPGKFRDTAFGPETARHGIAVLSWDPFGEGERLQYMDRKTDKPLIGFGSPEHSQASIPANLAGQSVARYFVYDAMRGIDYLQSRPDIDPKRIGAFGCSGGGTITAYLTALDPRVQAAGTACYLTTMDELLASKGPQEAEQTMWGFIQSGLDLADYVELAAPRPYAMISTTEDMFPFAGASKVHEEAQRFYALFGAQDKLHWIVGPGPHGNLRPITPQIISFFVQTLHATGGTPLPPIEAPADPSLSSVPPPTKPAISDLQVTPTGQILSSLGGVTIAGVIKEAAEPELAARKPLSLTGLRKAIFDVTGAQENLTGKAEAETGSRSMKGGLQHITNTLQRPGIVAVNTLDIIPDSEHGKLSATFIFGTESPEKIAEMDHAEDIASGKNNTPREVIVVQLRPSVDEEDNSEGSPFGPFYRTAQRAILVGKTVTGIRIDEIRASLDELCEEPQVNCADIEARASGPSSLALLHAAVLDPRIRHLEVSNLLVSYQDILDTPMHLHQSEQLVPGVLSRYDISDLLRVLQGRVTVLSRINAAGVEVK